MFPPISRRSIARAHHLWHRGAAWTLGPLLVGAMAVGLALGSDRATRLNAVLIAAWRFAPLIYMPAGFVLIAWLTQRYFPGAQGSGIPQTIAAIEEEGEAKTSHLLSLRIAAGKSLLTLAALAIGASVGREGPTVQIGASIMHAFYRKGPFQGARLRRILITAGGAAGIAAAFNTPLAGIMFAIEELSKKHVFNGNSSTLVTVILSGLISLAVLGNYTYFGSSAATLAWPSGVMTVLVCGLAGGAAGGLFSRLMLSCTARAAAVVRPRRLQFAALCGLLVAAIGIASGGLAFGTGYETTRTTLEANALLPWYFGAAKFAATLLTSVSGIPGGIFAPSLAVGAGFGDNLAALMPQLGSHSAVVLMVMAAYLSGVTRAPVTSFIIMLEMTNSHQMLVPLMSASVIASAASKLVCRSPLYHSLARQFART